MNSNKTPLALACGLLCSAAFAQSQTADATLAEVRVQAASEADAPGLGLDLQRKVNSGALGQRSALETPFSSATASAEAIAQSPPAKQADLFYTDASVQDTGSTAGGWASYTQVRGLELDWQSAYRIDGNPFISYSTILPFEQFERVDLLKGATGYLYGFGSPGGLINYVTKKPPAGADEKVRSVTVGTTSSSLWRTQADLGGRFGDDGRFGYRLNATHEQGEAANGSSLRRNAVSLALDARLTRDLTWELQAMDQARHGKNDTASIIAGSATGFTGSVLPAPIRNNGSLNLEGTRTDSRFKYVSTGLKYQLAPDWQLSASYSHTGTSTRRAESSMYLLDQAGDYADYRSNFSEKFRFDQVQAMLQGRVNAGGVRHDIAVGLSSQKMTGAYSDYNFTDLGLGNLYQPSSHALYYDTVPETYKQTAITQRALFASDTVTLTPKWQVLAGLRATRYVQQSFDATGAETDRYQKSGVLTPTLALMYKFAPRTMAYASTIQALEPGQRVSDTTLSNYGAQLNPVKSRQYEVGIKTDQQGWSATAALFRIEKTAIYSNGQTMLENGQSTYQGLELAATADLTPQWRVGTSLMLLDATYGQGSDGVAGNRIAGTARLIAGAQVGYRVPQVPGLQLLAGVKYTGSTPLDAANSLQMPSYALWNLGASYDTLMGGLPTTFRLQVNNATDRRYWAFQYAGYIRPGDPRSVSLSATVRF